MTVDSDNDNIGINNFFNNNEENLIVQTNVQSKDHVIVNNEKFIEKVTSGLDNIESN